jgi:hypothetical protein
MKIYTLTAAAALLVSGPVFAMDPPLMLGDFSANVEEATSSYVDQRTQSSNIDRMTTASMGEMRTGEMWSANAPEGREFSTPVFPWEYPGGR